MKDKNLGNHVSEERAPVTRKTATVKDYATMKQSTSPAVRDTVPTKKQSSMVDHADMRKESIENWVQVDAKRSQATKSVIFQKPGGTIVR